MSEEIPKPYMAKRVTYLSCDPTTSGPMETGTPQVTLTMAWQDVIEPPMLLTIDDAKRIVVGMLRSIAYHKDERAKSILEDFFPGVSVGCGNWIAKPLSVTNPLSFDAAINHVLQSAIEKPVSKPPIPKPPIEEEFDDEGPIRETVPLRVKTRYGRKVGRFEVQAAFAQDDVWILLCISPLHLKRHQSLVLVPPGAKLLRSKTIINKARWQIYLNMPIGADATFEYAGWIKKSLEDIHRQIGSRVYVLPQGVCHPREKRNERAEDEF